MAKKVGKKPARRDDIVRLDFDFETHRQILSAVDRLRDAERAVARADACREHTLAATQTANTALGKAIRERDNARAALFDLVTSTATEDPDA